MKEFKASAYIASAVAAVSTFFYHLRPYLLQSPPNAVALGVIGIAVALFIYGLIAGPILLAGISKQARRKAQRIFRYAFWGFTIAAIIGFLGPEIPPLITSISFCFALACYMLRAAAKYPPKQFLKVA